MYRLLAHGTALKTAHDCTAFQSPVSVMWLAVRSTDLFLAHCCSPSGLGWFIVLVFDWHISGGNYFLMKNACISSACWHPVFSCVPNIASDSQPFLITWLFKDNQRIKTMPLCSLVWIRSHTYYLFIWHSLIINICPPVHLTDWPFVPIKFIC